MIRGALRIVLLLLLPLATGAAVDPGTFDQYSFRQHPGAQLPLDAQLLDEAGRRVTLGSQFQSRPVVLILEYLRCQNLCSLVLRSAGRSIQEAHLVPGRDVDLVAVSIDPRDTSADAMAARAQYAASIGVPAQAGPGLHFLTGPPGEVARIAAAVGFPYRFDRASGQFAHPAGFVVATPTGRISRYMLGLDPAPSALRAAVVGAGQGAVEPPAHPLLLLCFGYDPDDASAPALAMRLVRWASLAMVAGCVLLVGFLSLRHRRA